MHRLTPVLPIRLLLVALAVLALNLACSDQGDPVSTQNTPPTAVDDSYSLLRGATLDAVAGGAPPGVLDNDSDEDEDALTAHVVEDPRHGTLSLNEDGSFRYVHGGGDAPSDTFVYEARDPAGATDQARAVLSILAPDACTIALSAPQAGESYELGEPMAIAWTSANTSGEVDIQLYRAATFVATLVTATEDDGSHAWTVDDFGEGEADDYRIRIFDTNDQECEAFSAAFSIVEPIPPVSYSVDVQPIFGVCLGCHGANGGLDLAEGESYANLVGVVSNGWAPDLRVKAGSPDESVLYLKLTGDMDYGSDMPPGSPLPSEQIETVRRWIEEGALDN